MHSVTIVVLLAISTLSFGSYVDNEAVNDPPGDFSDDVAHVTDDARPRPRRCCLPPRYEGRAGMQTDTDLKTQGMFSVAIFFPRYAVDTKRQLYAMDEIAISKYGRENMTTIIDAKKSVAYVFNRATKMCRRIALPPGMDTNPCIPADAKFVGPVALGAGRHALRCDVWMMNKTSQSPIPYEMNVTLIMQPEGCIPVMETVNGNTNGTRTASFMTFMDIRPHIRDPGVFDVPSYCKKAEDADTKIFSAMANHVISKLR